MDYLYNFVLHIHDENYNSNHHYIPLHFEKQVFLLKNILLENNYIISQFGFEDIIYVDNLSLHRIIDFINYNKPISNNAINTLKEHNISIKTINDILNTDYKYYYELTMGNFNRISFKFPNINLEFVMS